MEGHINGNDLDAEDIRNVMKARQNGENIKRIADVLRRLDDDRRKLEEKVNGLKFALTTLQMENQSLKTQVSQLQVKLYTGGPTEAG